MRLITNPIIGFRTFTGVRTRLKPVNDNTAKGMLKQRLLRKLDSLFFKKQLQEPPD